MANQRLNIDIVAKDKSKQAFNRLQGTLSKVRGSIFNLKNAFIGLGAGIVLKGIVSAGMQIEELGVQLEALFGSAKKGKDALDVVTKFAKTTPFELSNIQQGVTALATVSEKAESLGISFEELLKITGNTAVQLGGDFALASQQIQRSFSAGIGSADLFRDRAVTAMAGFSAGVKTSVDESILGLARAFGTGGKFGELTSKLANTLKGTISNLKDAFFTIQTEIASGFFDELKRQLGDLKKFTETNDEAIRRLSREMGENLAVAVLKLSNGIKILTTNFRDFQSVIGLLAVAFGGFLGKIAGLSLIIDDINRRFKALAGTTEKKLLPDARDFHKVMIQTKKELFDIAQIQESIAKAKEKELQIARFIQEESNKNRIKFHDLEKEGVKKFREQNDIQGQVLEKIKQQNAEFSVSNEIVSFINRGIDSFSRGLAESLILGKNLKETFSNMARTLAVEVLSQLISIVAKKGVELAIEKMITNEKRKQVALSSASGGSSLFSMAKTFLGFSKGGAVSKGNPIVVGERGPEMFIPNSTGQITQSARGTGSSGATTVNFNINTVDASGFEELLNRSRGTITQLINNAVNERGSKNLI
tara:strand:- start:741 stop:2513 length:1773 start_codon:yes stop_codon:yes gene_type:complete